MNLGFVFMILKMSLQLTQKVQVMYLLKHGSMIKKRKKLIAITDAKMVKLLSIIDLFILLKHQENKTI
jgi:hypothetical protein